MSHAPTSIALSSDSAELDSLQARLLALFAQNGLAELAAFQLACATMEAVNNCIKHAYGGSGGRPIVLSITSHSDEITIEIRDQGLPMSVDVMEPRAMPDAEAESGRGWPIIQQWTDAVAYRRIADENVLTLSRQIDPAPGLSPPVAAPTVGPAAGRAEHQDRTSDHP